MAFAMRIARLLAAICVVAHGAPEKKELPVPDTLGWGDDDPVVIYFAEFLLARWVLDHAPWNAYHSGLALENKKTGEKVIFDYSPDDTTSVMKKLVPEVNIDSMWRAVVLGDVGIKWRNKAGMIFKKYWPKQYENIKKIGKTNGKVINGFSKWVKEEFMPKITTFDALELVLINGTAIRSTMCHDFVTDSLWYFYNNSVKMKTKEPIFRDHIIMYGSEVSDLPADDEPVSARDNRMSLRYLRLLQMFYTKIAAQFTHGREALIVTWKLGLPVLYRNKGKSYRVQVTPPFLNYCYLPLAIPPKIHNLLEPNKLCALSVGANITNVSVPIEFNQTKFANMEFGDILNQPVALSPEGRLDRDEVFGGLVLIILAALLQVKPATDAGKEKAKAKAKAKDNVKDRAVAASG